MTNTGASSVDDHEQLKNVTLREITDSEGITHRPLETTLVGNEGPIDPATETTLESMLNALFDFTDPDNPVLKLPGLKSDYSDDSTQLGDSIQITNKPMPVNFYTNAASPTAGTMFGCNGERKNLLLTITRTNVTSNTIQFYRSTDGNYFGPLLGTRINPDASITTGVSSTSTATEMWEFDIEGVEFVSMYLSAIAGTGAGVTVAGIVI